MAFDINTARPEAKKGFDISTAKPFTSNLTEADIPLGFPAAQQQIQPVQQPTAAEQLPVIGGAISYGKDVAQTGKALLSGIPATIAGTVMPPVEKALGALSGKQTPDLLTLQDQYMSAFQAQPDRQGAQQMLGSIGNALQPLEALPPVLGAGLPQMNAIARSASMRPELPVDTTPSKTMQQALDINRGVERKDLAPLMTTAENPMVPVKDSIAKQAMLLGASDKLVQTAKTLSAADKKKVSQMLDVIGRSEDELTYSKFNRPSDIVGDSLKDRIAYVKQVNRSAGNEIDAAAEKLKGQAVDVGEPVNNFISSLENMGVTLKNNVPQFKGSDIEGFGADEKIIAQVIGRMRETKAPDAYDVHRLKRYIDRNVTYGKSSEGGVSPQTVNVLKELRANLDGMLDSQFADYNKANTRYSDTIRALDDIQTAAGKIDLLGEGSERALGARARALLSNQQKRIDLENSIKSVDEVAKKYNGKFDDDIMSQVAVVDELEKLFNVRSPTSLGGELNKTAEAANQLRQRGIVETGFEKGLGLFRKSDEQRRKETLAALKKLMARGEK